MPTSSMDGSPPFRGGAPPDSRTLYHGGELVKWARNRLDRGALYENSWEPRIPGDISGPGWAVLSGEATAGSTNRQVDLVEVEPEVETGHG